MRKTVCLLALLFLAFAPAAHAAKPSRATINLTGTPVYGGHVVIDVTTAHDGPVTVMVDCYQGDTFVYQAGSFDLTTYGPQDYTLASQVWTSGEADCTATATGWKLSRPRALGSLDFHVGP